jgi:hypothetical protein
MRRKPLIGPPAFLALLVVGLVFITLPAFAELEQAAVANTGDTAWVLTSAALVMLMTAPGLALFYGGLVSHPNYLSTLMHSFFLLCLISVQWVLFGYTLAFGPDKGGWLGGFDFLFFSGVGQEPIAGQTIPHLAFAIYQGVFAVITPALITGAFAERMRFSAFVLFSLLWATLVYDPLAHWVWGGGWLMKKGALDFAGGTVVHISSGVSALVAAIVVGRRRGHPQTSFPPHSVPVTLLGGSLLWFGWFGFNAGSALGASGLAASAFVTTHTAAAVTGLCWALIEWVHRGKPTVLGTVTGRWPASSRSRPPRASSPFPPLSRSASAARSSATSGSTCSSRGSATTTRSTCSACTASGEHGVRSPPASSRPRPSIPRERTVFSTAIPGSSASSFSASLPVGRWRSWARS